MAIYKFRPKRNNKFQTMNIEVKWKEASNRNLNSSKMNENPKLLKYHQKTITELWESKQ